MINRQLVHDFEARLKQGKALILMGPRQVGKTTLIKMAVKSKKKVLWLNADDYFVQEMFEKPSVATFKQRFGDAEIVVIDEAQRISDVGVKLKLITDELKNIQLIATGSSAFELANKINEPLTGRKWEYQLYPLSFKEMADHHGLMEEERLLQHRLIYGYYPEVVNAKGNEKEILQQLTDSFLFKDVLIWDKIKKPEKLIKLLQALAFQVGSQVSYNELSQLVQLDKETIEKYIMLLEQCFVIYRLGSFTRNLRNELKNTRKIYFYDNGIRNALIANFQPFELRTDKGALWENFLISERLKQNKYNKRWVNAYFWRTHAQQEVDFIEDTDGQLYAFEFKWKDNGKNKITRAFSTGYPNAILKTITKENYLEFVL